ncbi:hypothetical protein FNF27_08021 [Cafeteria roenbergensis]|uniref:Glycosyltransferase 61 catalytic domain-containing protein n=1 Tax=Cafeteria roenbergensis TaxID=33653 RepID=A0A5A8DDU5_CAFRO|nr:hypothetical protein FNF27_08021 [Cafeteria roenbergensis]
MALPAGSRRRAGEHSHRRSLGASSLRWSPLTVVSVGAALVLGLFGLLSLFLASQDCGSTRSRFRAVARQGTRVFGWIRSAVGATSGASTWPHGSQAANASELRCAVVGEAAGRPSRACAFRSVCVDAGTLDLLFFTGERGGAGQAAAAAGSFVSDDEAALFGGRSRPADGTERAGFVGARKPESDTGRGLTVRFVAGAPGSIREAAADHRPASIAAFERVVWLRAGVPGAPDAHALVSLFWPENFGHVLGDDVLPAVALARTLGVPASRVSPVALSDLDSIGAPEKRTNIGAGAYARARRFLAELFGAALGPDCGQAARSPPPVLGMDPPFQPRPTSLLHGDGPLPPTLAAAGARGAGQCPVFDQNPCGQPERDAAMSPVVGRAVCSEGVPPEKTAVCFDSLLVGSDALGMWHPSGRAHWRPMRRRIVASLNASHVHPGPEAGVLLLVKAGARGIVNLDDIADKAARALRVPVTVADPAAMSLAAQAAAVRSAAVVLTASGAVSFALAFAHPSSSLLVLETFTVDPGTGKPQPYRLEGWLWDADAHLDVSHVPLAAEDVVPLEDVSEPSVRAKLEAYKASGQLDLFWKYSQLRPRPEALIPQLAGALAVARRRICAASARA